MSTFESILLLILATWRISSILYDEVGPWEFFLWMRKKVFRVRYVDGEPAIYPILVEPLSCFWCLTLIVSLTLTTCCVGWSDVSRGILLWLSSSSGAIFIERWVLRSKARM